MIIQQTRHFAKRKKKWHADQQRLLDDAVLMVAKNPSLGELKKGDLQGVRVYKFKIKNQEYLLAYLAMKDTITLLEIGVHENFYRDLKKK